MFATFSMVETLESRQFLSAAPASGELTIGTPPPQQIALLLPAVQPSREAAKPSSSKSPPPSTTGELAAVDNSPSTAARMQCQNNLKQIGLASH